MDIRSLHFLAQNPFKKSLDISWKEGIAGSVMQASMDEYLIPLGLFLGATPMDIGFLVAIPHLLGSLSQFFAVKAAEIFSSRLKFLVRATLLQALFLLPLALFPLIVFPSRILALIVFVTLFRVLANLIATVWGSLASDYLAPEERGKYFGWRSRITGLAGVITAIAGGILLNISRIFSTAVGFCILFATTASARFISSTLMSQMEDVPEQKKPEDAFTFFMFLRRFRESNFVKFVFYVGSITFATMLAAPYFSVYMLQDLKFSYLTYMFIHMGAVAASIISFPLWGKHADRVGNAKILKTTSLLIPLIPVLWLFSSNLVYLFLIEIFAGFVWGGFNLCSLNFIYDAVSPGKRVRCLGYFSFINGVATFVGAGLGGYLAERLPMLNGSRILTLFVISAFFRLLSHFLLSRQFHEVRPSAQKISSVELFFSVVGIRPFLEKERDWSVLSFLKRSPWKD
ncbi:MAG TPA: MFS transporter [Candidatus Omnitrophota bacterium]|nr:MFS transporter [Candidatus Omnitrophota bacterium]HRY86137.1 MFS transporter [Candidatus Omnitrophota bacterium]